MREKVRSCNGGNHPKTVLKASDYKIGGLLVFTAHFCEEAAWSNGQGCGSFKAEVGVRFSPLQPTGLVCLQASESGGAMPGRSMAGRESLKLVMSVRFTPRQPFIAVQ